MTAPRLDRARIGWALAALALLGWIATTALAGTDPFDLPDARSYWHEATALVEQGELREPFDTGTAPTSWRPPLYGGLLAVLQAAGMGPGAAARVNQLLLLAAAALLYACARRLGAGRGASAAVGLIYLWYPAANRLAGTLMSESLFMALSLAALALSLAEATTRRREVARLVGCGVLCGLALLTRTVFYAWIPGVALLALSRPPTPTLPPLRGKREPRGKALPRGGGKALPRWAAVGLLAVGLVAAVGPWTVRNAQVHGRLVLVNTSGAYNFWAGNVFDANGVKDAGTRAWLVELRAGHSEAEVADELSARAWAAIADAPGETAERWGRNAMALWTTTRGAATSRPGELALLAAQLFLLLAAARALQRQPRDRRRWALASIPLLVTALHAVTFVDWRFALPLIPPALLLALLARASVGLGGPEPGDAHHRGGGAPG